MGFNFTFDLFFYGLLAIIVVGVIVLNVGKANSIVNDNFQEGDFLDAQEKERFEEYTTDYTSLWDSIFVLLMIALTAASWYGSYRLSENGIMLLVSVILIALLMWVGAFLSNSFDTFLSYDSLSEFQGDFPNMLWIMDNLLVVIFIQTFGGLIVGIIGARNEL